MPNRHKRTMKYMQMIETAKAADCAGVIYDAFFQARTRAEEAEAEVKRLRTREKELVNCLKLYVTFFDNCFKDPHHNETYGATETNGMAVKFSKMIKEVENDL